MLPSQRRALVWRGSASIVLCLMLASMVGCHQKKRDVRPEPATVNDGYSETAKDQSTATSQSASFDEASNKKVTRVEELLETFPGVQVQRTAGGGYSVTIRGVGSFMSSEQPLWVIDGVPVEVVPGRGLSWLSPSDVERIDVLKNPSDTAIYGVRGANGVIVITTKRNR